MEQEKCETVKEANNRDLEHNHDCVHGSISETRMTVNQTNGKSCPLSLPWNICFRSSMDSLWHQFIPFFMQIGCAKQFFKIVSSQEKFNDQCTTDHAVNVPEMFEDILTRIGRCLFSPVDHEVSVNNKHWFASNLSTYQYPLKLLPKIPKFRGCGGGWVIMTV